MPDLPLAQISLNELAHCRASVARAAGAGKMAMAQAEQAVRRWAGIAAWFGAVLPEELHPWKGVQCWIDHAAPGQSAASWQAELAKELRRVTLKATFHHEAEPENPARIARAAGLIALDRELASAAGLGPLFSGGEETRQAA